MRRLARAVLARSGWELVRPADREAQDLADLSAGDRGIVARVAPYTMTSPERRASLIGAVDHVVRHGIEGAVVECGVWRGGSMMAVALALLARGDPSRELYLYDTFEGMSEPTDLDRGPAGEPARSQLDRAARDEAVWAVAGLDDVQANLGSTGYPRERVHLVRGKVEETIPATLPGAIALLRLDTDWYESTRHELEHLYPLLARHGVLIIDDYGHWQGARRAVDEYFAASAEPVFLHRVDYTARLVIKGA
jgi:O-methyltransferase